MNERNDSIEKRLEHLERKCRRLRLWCASVTGLLLVACTAAALAPRENTVRAERFEVVGKDGEVRAVLGEILVPGGMGLQIGDPLANRAFAMLGVFPAKDSGTSPAKVGALLQLESASNPDPTIFQAHVFDRVGSCRLMNDSRSIGSSLQPELTRFEMTTSDAESTEDEKYQERFEVIVEGDKTSMTAASPTGEVLFRQP